MRKLLKTVCSLTAALLATVLADEVSACTPPPPPPPWMTAEEIEAEWKQRVLDSQIGDWNLAVSIFIAQVESKGVVALSRDLQGRRAALVPVLSIKGPEVTRRIRIQHTGSLCGMTPGLDALDENATGYFMVYSLDETPTGASIFVTEPLDELVDPNVLAAWRLAYDRSTNP